MTENIYTGFGSQVVLDPKNPSLPDGVTNNGKGLASQCRDLRLRLRYFTIRACPEDVKNYATINTLEKNTSCKDLTKDFNIMSDDKILVIGTNSCDSFHSCASSTSINELSTPLQENGKFIHQFNKNKSDEDFNNQITMINAIFLNKKPPKKNQSEVKNEKLLSSTNIFDVPVVDKKFNIESDKSSGDKTCKCFSFQQQTENVEILQKGIGVEQNLSSIRTELLYERSNKTLFKPFKINRKTIYGTKKPLMSKIIGRKCHQAMLNKPLTNLEIKFTKASIKDNEMQCFTDDQDHIYKGILLELKHQVSEGYEIHFFESIQHTDHSIKLCFENSQENLNIDKIQNSDLDLEKISSNFDGTNRHESLLLNLNYKQQLSNSSIQSQEESEVDSGILSCKEEVIDLTSQNNLHFECAKSVDFDHSMQGEERNFTILYESEPKFSDLSLVDTFEIFFKNEDSWPDKTENVYVNPVNSEETLCEKNKSRENLINKQSEEKIDIHSDFTGISNATANTINTFSKRRRSTLRSSLPVIEESPEPYDLLDNDYCLVDTLGRPIHLFDQRGFPLTDSCGRPLRTAKGDLLLKCDDNGVPVVDENTLIFDMYGRQPHEEGFQPWMFPQNSKASRLTMGDGCPLVLFDVEGKPLTSVSGTMLVDSFGRSLLKLSNCFGQHLPLS